MRTIKFRGKRIDGKGWIFGNLVLGAHNRAFIVPNFDDKRKSPYLPYVYEVTSSTVGQFTGLLDKNGNDIYEGDILKNNSYPYEEEIEIGFHNGMFTDSGNNLPIGLDDEGMHVPAEDIYEIIGNIHNPTT